VVALGAADVAANVASALGASGRVLVTSMSRQGAHLVRQWTREAATTHSVPWRDGTGPPPQ
jgi:hypothetical protein